jgi:hypothetical protein
MDSRGRHAINNFRDDSRQDARERDQRRYYDRDYRNYHRWDYREDARYRSWGLKGMELIVPSTNSTKRSRELIGSIATNIRIVTIAGNSRGLPVPNDSRDSLPFTTIPASSSVSALRQLA